MTDFPCESINRRRLKQLTPAQKRHRRALLTLQQQYSADLNQDRISAGVIPTFPLITWSLPHVSA